MTFKLNLLVIPPNDEILITLVPVLVAISCDCFSESEFTTDINELISLNSTGSEIISVHCPVGLLTSIL